MAGTGPIARSFGRTALEYERGRPDWPAEAVDRPAAALGLAPDAVVLDVAAGTGKLTKLLVDRFARVVAVEPDEEMRALLAANAPAAEVRAGTAEHLLLGDATIDAAFVGDAFHWFDAPAALRELARVLRPAGGLVVLWKMWAAGDFEPALPTGLVRDLRAVFERAGRPGSDRYAAMEWRAPFDGSAFEPLRDETIEKTIELTHDQAVSLWLSVSSVASLPESERASLARDLDAGLADRYRLHERVHLYWTRLDVSRAQRAETTPT